MRPSLVIFDCDGVLVDSERIAAEGMVESLRILGLDMSYAEIRREFVGLTWSDMVARIERKLGGPIPPDWSSRTRDRDRARFLSELQPVPHVRDVVHRLRDAAIPYCVASSGDPAKMQATLGATDLLPLFDDVLFSATMVARGKPHPDLFLFAADQMGHAPDGCVVIEDSLPGVGAARAADMRVLAYAGDPHTDDAALADAGAEVFHDMRDVPRLIGLA